MKTKKIVTLCFACIFLGLGSPVILFAQNMRSDSYIIQFGNFNITSGEKSGGGYKVTDTVGQTAPGEYSSSGYKVFSGFQYIYGLSEFSFRISSLDIDLGELQPGSFSSQAHELSITTRSGGYAVLARAEHPLEQDDGTNIPFTSCDNNCTLTNAEPWTITNNAGFGFSVAGINRSPDFINNTYFRPFANGATSEPASVIATSNNVVNDDSLTVTYKATILGSQEAGSYQTAIEYTAVPTF